MGKWKASKLPGACEGVLTCSTGLEIGQKTYYNKNLQQELESATLEVSMTIKGDTLIQVTSNLDFKSLQIDLS